MSDIIECVIYLGQQGNLNLHNFSLLSSNYTCTVFSTSPDHKWYYHIVHTLSSPLNDIRNFVQNYFTVHVVIFYQSCSFSSYHRLISHEQCIKEHSHIFANNVVLQW